MTTAQDRFFVTAVTIAARLSQSVDDVSNVSLQTMNAQSLIKRAGDELRPIRPIATYMNSLSEDLAGQVREVNRVALEISRLSLDEFLETMAVEQFRRARDIGQDALHIGTIADASARSENKSQQFVKALTARLQDLRTLLSHIESSMLSVEIVLSCLRLEVGKIGPEFKPSFETLIERFEEASHNIRSAGGECRRQIEA